MAKQKGAKKETDFIGSMVPEPNPVMNEQQFQQFMGVLNDRYTLRREIIEKLLYPKRNIDTECNYPISIDISDYTAMFERFGLAARIIEFWPDECWKQPPNVYETEEDRETEFEQAWDALIEQCRVWNILARADILSGIGQYGVVLLGFGDGAELSQPVNGLDDAGNPTGTVKNTLLYLRPFSQSAVRIKKKEIDATNPRYGYPKVYTVKFESEGEEKTQSKDVHWTRVVHLADNRLDSEVYGVPRLRRLYNNMLDVKKISGGSGEMFWRGGFPGYSLEMSPEAEKVGAALTDVDKESMKEQMWYYFQGLQRMMYFQGVNVKQLAPQVADPSHHLDWHVKLIAMSMGVPYRILLGSEEAKLASTQDKRTWNERIQKRRDNYVTPLLIRLLVDRLIHLGVLPEPKEYFVKWPPLDMPTQADIAEVAERRTNALAKYVATGVEAIMAPRDYLMTVHKLTRDEVDAIEAGMEELGKEVDDE